MNSSFDEILKAGHCELELTEPERRMIDIIIDIDRK